MQNVEVKAVQTYQKNLNYLEKNHQKLFERISLLNAMIESGKYEEKYSLEYKEEGYFDIKEFASDEYLYKMDSTKHAKNMVNMVDKKRSGGVFKALKYVRANESQAEIIDKSELSFHNALWATIKLINYVNKYTPPTTYLKRVNKAIFLDIGLGLHILDSANKLQSRILFIKERNLEIFRLSLFVTDYEEIASGRTLYFSILEKVENEEKIFIDFLNNGNNYNLYIKHIPFNDSYKETLLQFQKYVLSQSYINYGYSAILLRYIDSPKYLVKEYSFLDVSRRHIDNIFLKKPVLLLFSGPSTSKNIEWVKKNRERFIVVSALSTCRLLSSVNLKPDVVIHMDPGEKTALLFEGLDVDEYFKDINVILSPNVTEDTVNRFQKSQIHFVEQGSKYKQGFGILTSPSVGEYGYGISLIFGANDIYMLGIDLALDQETLMTHAGSFHFAQRKGTQTKDTASLDPSNSIHYVKGNFTDEVAGIAAYDLSIGQFAMFTKYLKNANQNVYNLSNGAYLEGSKPLHIEEYDWDKFDMLDRAGVKKDLDDFFKEIGSSEFRDIDKEAMLLQVKEAKKLKKEIQKHQKKKFNDSDKYLSELSSLSWSLSDMEYKTNSDLAQVYYEYFQTILSYIYDLFNTQQLENPKKHIVEIDKILVKQLLKIANAYIDKMQSYLNKEE